MVDIPAEQVLLTVNALAHQYWGSQCWPMLEVHATRVGGVKKMIYEGKLGSVAPCRVGYTSQARCLEFSPLNGSCLVYGR